MLLALVKWGGRFTELSVNVLGDNTGALQNALALKGRGSMLAVAKEVSWRWARHGWRFLVSHLPSEFNCTADALSRVADPSQKVAWPTDDLATAESVVAPKLGDLWRASPR